MGSTAREQRATLGGDNYFGSGVASFPDVTHRPHKDATASPLRVAATGTSVGGSWPALLKGRSSGGRGTAPATARTSQHIFGYRAWARSRPSAWPWLAIKTVLST